MGGGYSPSPGVIYPTLTMLEEQGFAQITAEDGKKLYRATPDGEAFLKANQASLDAIQARIDAVARERNVVPDARIIRAIENLKTALRLRMAGGPIPDERVQAIAAAIDAAAGEAERADRDDVSGWPVATRPAGPIRQPETLLRPGDVPMSHSRPESVPPCPTMPPAPHWPDGSGARTRALGGRDPGRRALDISKRSPPCGTCARPRTPPPPCAPPPARRSARPTPCSPTPRRAPRPHPPLAARADRPAGDQGRRRHLRHLHAGTGDRGTRPRRHQRRRARSAPRSRAWSATIWAS